MKFEINGEVVEVEGAQGVEVARGADRLYVRSGAGTQTAVVVRRGDTTYVSIGGNVYEVRPPARGGRSSHVHGAGEARAPMPGQIVEVTVSEGESVTAGQKLAVLEAMKMQQPIIAGISGTVTSLPVAVGDQLVEGALVALVTADDEP